MDPGRVLAVDELFAVVRDKYPLSDELGEDANSLMAGTGPSIVWRSWPGPAPGQHVLPQRQMHFQTTTHRLHQILLSQVAVDKGLRVISNCQRREDRRDPTALPFQKRWCVPRG